MQRTGGSRYDATQQHAAMQFTVDHETCTTRRRQRRRHLDGHRAASPLPTLPSRLANLSYSTRAGNAAIRIRTRVLPLARGVAARPYVPATAYARVRHAVRVRRGSSVGRAVGRAVRYLARPLTRSRLRRRPTARLASAISDRTVSSSVFVTRLVAICLRHTHTWSACIATAGPIGLVALATAGLVCRFS